MASTLRAVRTLPLVTRQRMLSGLSFADRVSLSLFVLGQIWLPSAHSALGGALEVY